LVGRGLPRPLYSPSMGLVILLKRPLYIVWNECINGPDHFVYGKVLIRGTKLIKNPNL
jgi:hypothetical protein